VEDDPDAWPLDFIVAMMPKHTPPALTLDDDDEEEEEEDEEENGGDEVGEAPEPEIAQPSPPVLGRGRCRLPVDYMGHCPSSYNPADDEETQVVPPPLSESVLFFKLEMLTHYQAIRMRKANQYR
jgi:hypothetical protein